MDEYLKSTFGEDNLTELEIVNENKAKWALGTIAGTKVGTVGPMKPKFYLYGESIVRYANNEHDMLAIKAVKEINGEAVYCTQNSEFKRI